MDGFKEDLLGG